MSNRDSRLSLNLPKSKGAPRSVLFAPRWLFLWRILITTVIAVKHSKGVTFVADTQATGEGGDIYRVVKIRKNRQFVISGGGDCAPLDIALHLWKPPYCTVKDREDLLHFMIVKVVPSLKKIFTTHDYKYDPSPDAKQDGTTIIMAIHGEIFIIEKEFDVSMPQFNVAGTGSGAAYAIGAIRTGSSIEDAMNVAAENDTNSSAPFTTIEQSIEGDKVKVPVVKKRART